MLSLSSFTGTCALLSIIVISRNQANTIGMCLDSIQVATKPSGVENYEIVFGRRMARLISFVTIWVTTSGSCV